jgi:hypothetical protein
MPDQVGGRTGGRPDHPALRPSQTGPSLRGDRAERSLFALLHPGADYVLLSLSPLLAMGLSVAPWRLDDQDGNGRPQRAIGIRTAGPRWGGERGRAALPGLILATQDCRKSGSVLPCRPSCSCAAIVVKNLHVHRNMQIIVEPTPGFGAPTRNSRSQSPADGAEPHLGGFSHAPTG